MLTPMPKPVCLDPHHAVRQMEEVFGEDTCSAPLPDNLAVRMHGTLQNNGSEVLNSSILLQKPKRRWSSVVPRAVCGQPVHRGTDEVSGRSGFSILAKHVVVREDRNSGFRNDARDSKNC